MALEESFINGLKLILVIENSLSLLQELVLKLDPSVWVYLRAQFWGHYCFCCMSVIFIKLFLMLKSNYLLRIQIYFYMIKIFALYLTELILVYSICLNGLLESYRITPYLLVPSVLWHCWLGGRKGIRPVKNWVVGCWRGYLSGARCRLACGPADATAAHCLLLQ